MITEGKFYYAVTPRSEKIKCRERVKVLEIIGNFARCETVDNLVRSKEIYLILLCNISE